MKHGQTCVCSLCMRSNHGQYKSSFRKSVCFGLSFVKLSSPLILFLIFSSVFEWSQQLPIDSVVNKWCRVRACQNPQGCHVGPCVLVGQLLLKTSSWFLWQMSTDNRFTQPEMRKQIAKRSTMIDILRWFSVLVCVVSELQ